MDSSYRVFLKNLAIKDVNVFRGHVMTNGTIILSPMKKIEHKRGKYNNQETLPNRPKVALLGNEIEII